MLASRLPNLLRDSIAVVSAQMALSTISGSETAAELLVSPRSSSVPEVGTDAVSIMSDVPVTFGERD